MVKWPSEKNKNHDFGRKNQGVERTKGTNCIKNVLKGLKIASFWVINSPRPPHLCTSGKKLISKVGRGGGGVIEMYIIYPFVNK